MPTANEDRTHHLDDFAGLLEAMIGEGFEFAVIGGCAVGAYARLMSAQAPTRDIDLYCTGQTLNAALDWAQKNGVAIENRPRPRSVPVAVLRWKGLEVNILTQSHGLPPPEQVVRLARLFRLSRHGGLPVLVADPFDILANKLKVNRPKDRPHIDLLLRFVEEEIVRAFREQTEPRERLAPARRFLAATGARTLPEAIAARLLPLTRTDADLRFLMNHVPTALQADAVVARAGQRADLAAELAAIRKHRRLRA